MDKSPFLGTGHTFASLYIFGIIPKRRNWLKREQKGDASCEDSSRRMRLLRPFGPDALPTFNVCRIDSTSNGVRMIEVNWVRYAGGGSGGRMACCSLRMV